MPKARFMQKIGLFPLSHAKHKITKFQIMCLWSQAKILLTVIFLFNQIKIKSRYPCDCDES